MILLAAAGCGGERRDAALELTELLQRTHGVLQGKLDRAGLDLTREQDGKLLAVLRVPRSLRVRDEQTGTMRYRAGDACWRQEPGQPPVSLAGADRAELLAFDAAVAAVLLQPVTLAEAVAWTTEGRIRFRAGGEDWELAVSRDGLPASLHGPAGVVRFLAWQDNELTVLPQRVEIDGVAWRVRFRDYDLMPDPGAFRPREPR